MRKIPTWEERAKRHPDHKGLVSSNMIHERITEEIEELRGYIDELLAERKKLLAIKKLAIELEKLTSNEDSLCEWDGEEWDELQDNIAKVGKKIKKLSGPT